MSARIGPPKRYPWWTRFAFAYTRRTTGKVPDPLRIFARRPRLMFATILYEWAIAETPKLPARGADGRDRMGELSLPLQPGLRRAGAGVLGGRFLRIAGAAGDQLNAVITLRLAACPPCATRAFGDRDAAHSQARPPLESIRPLAASAGRPDGRRGAPDRSGTE